MATIAHGGTEVQQVESASDPIPYGRGVRWTDERIAASNAIQAAEEPEEPYDVDDETIRNAIEPLMRVPEVSSVKVTRTHGHAFYKTSNLPACREDHYIVIVRVRGKVEPFFGDGDTLTDALEEVRAQVQAAEGAVNHA